MATQQNGSWPIYIQDRNGNQIYLTWERWEHALGHPSMHEELLDALLETIRNTILQLLQHAPLTAFIQLEESRDQTAPASRLHEIFAPAALQMAMAS